MSLQILLREQPERSIALVSETHALIFRKAEGPQTFASGGKAIPPRCMVEFCSKEVADLGQYATLRTQSAYGTLGLINVNADVFLCVITGSTLVATVRPGEHVQRIVSVDFFCLNRPDYDRGWVAGPPDFREEFSEYYDDRHSLDYQDGTPEHPCLAIKHVLGGGTFYYSVDFDLTNRLQNRITERSAFDVDSLDHSFLWNTYMVEPLIQFRSHLNPEDRQALDASHMLTSAIRGFVGTYPIPAASDPIKTNSTLPSSLTLISRLSCRRAGTRFNSRGIDDDGNVANFVETETVYYVPDGTCFSYAQIRGSVPIFWEQSSGLLPQQQKIQITRSPEATQPAFNKHFEDLELKYGTIHVLNLLSHHKPGEVDLTSRYDYHIREASLNQRLPKEKDAEHAMLKSTGFDYHAETKGQSYEAASIIRHLLRDQSNSFAFFMSLGLEEQTSVLLQQEGVFRTNCLDCLDRTNVVQTMLSQIGLELFFHQQNGRPLSDYWMRHSTLWADNGDALSKIYAGTGALKSSFTRSGKLSLAGALADVRKSATRLYINNFEDKGRQNIIDTLLGRLVDQAPVQLFDPINDYVTAELAKQAGEYTQTGQISIYAGTFNLNGKIQGLREDLSAWLCPRLEGSDMPDIVAVGFQEIVELNANNIMATDPARRQEWEVAVHRTLNEVAEARKADGYVMLRSGQLVGAALIVFVKEKVLPSIKNAEGSIKKTGLSGIAGNKGAVAIRLDFANTRICFVTAHLAAGFANYDERNRDYHTIAHGLRFQRNRSISDHDAVLWLGDFNYRIGLPSDRVRAAIKTGDIATLFKNDQLNLQMVAGHAFPFYWEGRISFNPTYKYDNGTDEYDTSEKQRIPAWCDRVLYKGDGLRLLHYNAAPLRFSDHRPVFAVFVCSVRVEDDAAKRQLAQTLYARRRQEIAGGGFKAGDTTDDDDDLLSYEAIEPGLPPASSEQNKWWMRNGLPVRSSIADAHAGHEPNPRRPPNPFTPSDEPDWVLVSASPPKGDAGSVGTTADSQARQDSKTKPEPPPSRRPLRQGSTASVSSIVANTGAARSGGTANLQGGGDGASAVLSRVDSIGSVASASALAPLSPAGSKKAAPPIPRKPVTLSQGSGDGSPRHQASISTLPSAQPSMQRPMQRPAQSPAQPAPQKLTKPAPAQREAGKVLDTGFPPPPRRMTGPSPSGAGAGTGFAPTASGRGSVGGGGAENTQPLPVRRGTDPPREQTQARLQKKMLPPPNLMDVDNDESGRILPSLTPARPR